MNRDWHASHRMPKNASMEQRVAWHVAHAMACACREMPRSIVDELKRRGGGGASSGGGARSGRRRVTR